MLTIDLAATIRCTSLVSGSDSIAGSMAPLIERPRHRRATTLPQAAPIFIVRCDRHGHERLKSEITNLQLDCRSSDEMQRRLINFGARATHVDDMAGFEVATKGMSPI